MSSPLYDPDISMPERLRMLAACKAVVIDRQLADWLRDTAHMFEKMERDLNNYVDAAQVDLLLAQRKIAEPAWLRARDEAIAAGQVIPLPRLRMGEGMEL